MSHEGQDNQGTGLRDVFDIVAKAPPERLLSLTFQLGESPEDNIIHALCLIVLQKEARALNKLQTLTDNYLASYLAEKWQMSGGKLDNFGVHCGNFQELTGESLGVLARIFKVLSEQRLCDPRLRNLAYKRALSTNNQKTSHCEDLEYDQLRQEAKVVCGPQIAESGSYRDPHHSLNEGTTTLKVTLSQDQSERAYSLPSPLQASMPSYPTHLEISVPPTASFQDDKITPETSEKSKLITPVLLVSEANNAPGQSETSEERQPQYNVPPGENTLSTVDETLATLSSRSASLISQDYQTKRATETKRALPKMPVANEMHESKGAEEEEEEATFYAFVILHAPEDADLAESMRETLESVIGSDCEGATFSGDFAVPGKSALRCVEDAIDNSAFTILLLTRNFNTRMQELETNTALINSINNVHKYNTVIPLLPRENCMPKRSIPKFLQTIVPLEESRNFERKIRKSLSPAEIKKQRRIWMKERRVKMEIERQEGLERLNQHQKQLLKECETTQLLEREHLSLLMKQKLHLDASLSPQVDGGDGRAWWQQHPNIHIEKASCIMIGNNSQMTVGEGVPKDDSIHREEEGQ